MNKKPLTVERVFRSVKLGDDKAVERWCQTGGDPNVMEPKGTKNSTLLHWAGWTGKPETVVALLRAGADFDATETSGKTPLHLAAYDGHAEVVKLLLRVGADYTLADTKGKLPCHLAIMSKKLDVARLFPNYRECAGDGGDDWTFDESMWDTDLHGLDVAAVRQQRRRAPAAPQQHEEHPSVDVSTTRVTEPDELVDGDPVGYVDRPHGWHRDVPAQPPTRLQVVGGESAYPVDGVYDILREYWNGYPVWGCGDRRIYTGTNGLWIVTEASVNMESNSGLITSRAQHAGLMPDFLGMGWETYEAEPGAPERGGWVEDRNVLITAVQPARSVGRSSVVSGSHAKDTASVTQSEGSPPPAASASGSTAGLPAELQARAVRIETKESDQRAKEVRQEERRRNDIRKYVQRDLEDRGLDVRQAGMNGTAEEERLRRKQEKKARKALKERTHSLRDGDASSAHASDFHSAAPSARSQPLLQQVVDRVREVLEQEFGSVTDGVDAMGVDLHRRGGLVSVDGLRRGLMRVRLRDLAASVVQAAGSTTDIDLGGWLPPDSDGFAALHRSASDVLGESTGRRRHETDEEREWRRQERRRLRREERERAQQERRVLRRAEREERRAERRRVRESERHKYLRRADAHTEPSPRPSLRPQHSEPSPRPPPPAGRTPRGRSRSTQRTSRARSVGGRSRSAASRASSSFASPARSLSRASRGSTSEFRRPWRPPGGQNVLTSQRRVSVLGFDAYKTHLTGWPPRQVRRTASAARHRAPSRSRGSPPDSSRGRSFHGWQLT